MLNYQVTSCFFCWNTLLYCALRRGFLRQTSWSG